MRAPVAMLCLLCGHLAVASVPCSATEPAVAEPAAAQTSAGRLVLGALEQRLRTRADFQQATVAGTGAPDDASVRWGGAHLYASTGLASVNEVVDIGRRRSYQQLSANVGVSWPLLGSRLHLNEEHRGRAAAALNLQLDTETRRRKALTELRGAYIEYWAAQQRAQLAADFLARRAGIEGVLQRRNAAGLLLESDMLELLGALDRAAVDEQDARIAQRAAADTIQVLLGEPIPMGAATTPLLDTRCRPLAAGLEKQPVLQELRAAADRAQTDPRGSPLYAWTSDLRVGYARTHEPSSGQNGGAAVIIWSFDYPLGERDLWRAERMRTRLRATRAEIEFEQNSLQLQHDIALLGQREALADESLRLANRVLAAATSRVRERELRAAGLAGDVLEQLQQARYQRYRAALAVVDAQQRLQQAHNAWTPVTPSVCDADFTVIASQDRPL